MANPTTNFGWVMPASTDLVTDLPADFAVFGDAVDSDLSTGGGYSTTATAAGTTTLTLTSNRTQFFTGSTTQTVVMPVTSTLALGWQLRIVNNSTGVVTVQSSGANTIYAVPAGGDVIFTCILASGTTAASWDYKNHVASAATGGLTLITRQSFSGVATTGTTFDSVFSSSYYQYLVRIESLYGATGTDDCQLQLRYAGPTTQATGYYGSTLESPYNSGAAVNTGSSNATQFTISADIGDSTYMGGGEINFTRVGNASEYPAWWGRYTNLTGNAGQVSFAGLVNTARTYTGFLLKSSSSNITGTLAVYGLAKA